jgi:dihydrofolate reductase
MGVMMTPSSSRGKRLLGRRRGRDHAHGHGQAFRSPARPQDLRDLRRPLAHSEEPAAAPLNNATKDVASTTLRSVEWQNSQLLEGPLGDAVNAVKAQDGPEIQVQGSADLIQSLHADGLIDEFNVWTFPVILGKGKRLFEPGTPAGGLEVIDSKVSPSGVMMTRLRAGVEIKGGSLVQADLDRRLTQEG